MDRQRAVDLLTRYRSGNCTEAEQQLIEGWILHGAAGPLNLTDEELLEDLLNIGKRLECALLETEPRTFRVRKWLPYAAAVVLTAAAGLFAWEQGHRKEMQEKAADATAQPLVFPGGNRATLTLADGRVIDLSEAQTEVLVKDVITYADGSPIVGTEASDSGLADEDSHAILATPKGGTYRIVLSDGTKVWLNSASTLKYPGRFSDNERVVELEGEAYFEVASLPQRSSGKKRPFLVKTSTQTIEVLGTEFNISAYEDDNEVKTTLVEGSLRVTLPSSQAGTAIIKAGQQSIVNETAINVSNVDVSQYIAWKDGNFHFDNTPLSEIMKQIARWYDVEVVYAGAVPRERFSGAMSRHVTLQTVLQLLQISEVNYRIEGKKLIIQ